MKRIAILLAAVPVLLLALPAMAAQQGIVVQSCGTLSNKNNPGSDGPIAVDINGNLCTGSGLPTSAASSGIASKTVTSAFVSSLVLKATAGNFYGAQINSSSSGLWVMLIDGTADPGNGTNAGCGTGAHATGCVVKWWQVPANTTYPIAEFPPLSMTNGMVLVCSL